MRRFVAAFLLLGLALPAYARIDTLRHYNPAGKKMYFRDAAIDVCVARFEPAAPGYLTDVYIALGGSASGSAELRVYGNEGGSMVPVLKHDLVKAIPLLKTREGEEIIHVRLPERIPVLFNQFFVSISAMSGDVYLISDSDKRLPSCRTEQGGEYYYQYVELGNSEWRSYHSAFRIDVVVDYFADSSPGYLEDITDSSGVDPALSSASIAWADINNDSYPDLLVDGRLYLNRGNGEFDDGTERAGLRGQAEACAFIDINNDNAPDILFLGCGESASASRLYLNNGDGTFSERTLALPPLPGVTAFAIADINNDGFPDLFVGRHGGDTAALSNYLFLNRNGEGFEDGTSALYGASGRTAGRCRGAMWVDYNNDGLPDLYITNSAGAPAELWRNRGNLSFELLTIGQNINDVHTLNGVGCDWADYDNDADLDLILAHSHPPLLVDRNYRLSTVFANAGAPTYSMNAVGAGQPGTTLEFEERQAGGTWGDVNNDGLPDLFITTVSPCHFNELYIQQRDGSLAPETFEYGLRRTAQGEDAVWIDFNNDGRLDLATGHNGRIRLFQNKSHSVNTSIQFDLVGKSSNRQAIGARVYVYADGSTYMREVVSGRGLKMQSAPRVHIGLGEERAVDSVVVQWPNGTREHFGAPAVNALHRLSEGRSSEVTAQYDDPALQAWPNPFSVEASLSYQVAAESPVRLTVYSLANKVVRSLVSERQVPGRYVTMWDGRDDNGVRVASGMYIIRVQVGNRESTTRLIVNE